MGQEGGQAGGERERPFRDRPPSPRGGRPSRAPGDRPRFAERRDERPRGERGERDRPYSRQERPAGGERPPRPPRDRPRFDNRRGERPREERRERPPSRQEQTSDRPDRSAGRPRYSDDRERPSGRGRFGKRPFHRPSGERPPPHGDRPCGRTGGRFREREPREAFESRPAEPVAPPPGLVLVGVEEVEVTIEKLVAGGEGLARYEGVPLFVARSAPGDRLRVRIVERRPDYGRAEVVEILEAGPARRPDPVPELADWGGCDLQHIRDEEQPILKAQAVRETLERMARLELPAELPVVHGDAWGYRLRTQLHTEVEGDVVRVGYHARGSHRLIQVSRCPILVPELEALLRGLPRQLGEALAASGAVPRRLDLAAGDGGAITASPLVPGLPHGTIATAVEGETYAYDAGCFFQAHRGLLPRLIEAAVGPWEGGLAYDLYAGVGLFSLPLARRYGRVVAVEGERHSARFARANARRGRDRSPAGGGRTPEVEVVPQAVESWIGDLPAGAARVVVDPPRTGLAMAVRRALVERRPERLTYVSCHAATLARDLAQLTPAFAVESVVLLDLFPQTGHMETVVQMVRR